MLELKITGANATELVNNAVQALGLLVNGARNSTAKPAAIDENKPVPTPPATQAESTPVEPEKSKRGRPAKAAKPDTKQVEDASAKKPAELPDGGDPIPDFLDRNKKPAVEPVVKQYTELDCRHALKTIFENYEKRARDAGETDEAKIMKDKVDYARPLVYGFGVSKVPDLKPEQYADFIAKAQPYIDGTVKVAA